MNLAKSNLGISVSPMGEAYEQYRLWKILFLLMLFVCLILVSILSLRSGSFSISPGETVWALFGRSADPKVNAVIRNMRMPRLVTAILAGWGLGIAGCVLQGILRNPLASPSTMGISQGAAFGAAFAIIVLGAGSQGSNTDINFSNPLLISLCAFVCSMGASFVILVLSSFVKISPEAMVLSGVALSSLFGGANTILQYFADNIQLASVVFWTFGDLGRTMWREVRIMATVVIFMTVFFILNRWNYNALESGEESSVSLGLRVGRMRIINMLACSLTASVIVSYLGIISFIGLIAPHIIRRIIGNNYCWLLPGSAIAGAIILLLSDFVARTIITPVILPIGAITSFLGAPVFLYMLFKGRAGTC